MGSESECLRIVSRGGLDILGSTIRILVWLLLINNIVKLIGIYLVPTRVIGGCQLFSCVCIVLYKHIIIVGRTPMRAVLQNVYKRIQVQEVNCKLKQAKRPNL
jgi:hypothetical protein